MDYTHHTAMNVWSYSCMCDNVVLIPHLTACYLHDEEDTVVSITPQNFQYSLGANITLYCNAFNVSQDLVPVWELPNKLPCSVYSMPNLCGHHYSASETYIEENCQWTTSLAIEHFDETLAGTYTCRVNGQLENITLELIGKL